MREFDIFEDLEAQFDIDFEDLEAQFDIDSLGFEPMVISKPKKPERDRGYFRRQRLRIIRNRVALIRGLHSSVYEMAIHETFEPGILAKKHPSPKERKEERRHVRKQNLLRYLEAA